MKTAKDVLKAIKDKTSSMSTLRFTDPRGKWQHVTFDQTLIDEDAFADGLMFDGSSIAGWKAINESDMTLMPDPTTACIDPFFAASTMVDHLRHSRSRQRPALQPRSALDRQEGRGLSEVDRHRRHRLLRPRGRVLRVRRRALHAPTPTTPASQLDSIELPINSDTIYEGGNLGHRIRTKGGYFPVPPQDSGAGHARRDAGGDGRRWAPSSRSTTTKWPPRSTSSA